MLLRLLVAVVSVTLVFGDICTEQTSACGCYGVRKWGCGWSTTSSTCRSGSTTECSECASGCIDGDLTSGCFTTNSTGATVRSAAVQACDTVFSACVAMPNCTCLTTAEKCFTDANCFGQAQCKSTAVEYGCSAAALGCHRATEGVTVDYVRQMEPTQYYQSCSTATNTFKKGGTACISFNPAGRNVHLSIVHNLNRDQIGGVIVVLNGVTTVLNADTLQHPYPFKSAMAATGEKFVEISRNPIDLAFRLTTPTTNANPEYMPHWTSDSYMYVTVYENEKSARSNSLSFEFNYNTVMNDVGRLGTDEITRNAKTKKFAGGSMLNFKPTGNRVLLSARPSNQAHEQSNTDWVFRVVTLGTRVTQVSEGDMVVINQGSCFSQLIYLNGWQSPVDMVREAAMYCWVDVTDINGVLKTSSHGANRRDPFVSHLKQANPTGYNGNTNRFSSFY